MTSLTLGRNKVFLNPLGKFEYRSIEKEKFKIGIEYKRTGDGGYFIASREKALVDLIYRTPGIRTLSQLDFFLFEDMRMEGSLLKNLDFSLIKTLIASYKKSSLKFLGSLWARL